MNFTFGYSTLPSQRPKRRRGVNLRKNVLSQTLSSQQPYEADLNLKRKASTFYTSPDVDGTRFEEDKDARQDLCCRSFSQSPSPIRGSYSDLLTDDRILDEERRNAPEYPEEISEDEDIPMSVIAAQTPIQLPNNEPISLKLCYSLQFRDVIEDQEELQHSKKRRKGSDLPDFAKVLGIWTDTQKITRDGYQALREILATSEDSNMRSIPNTLKTLQERCRDELPLLP
ncbi:hypothetical protein K3495_g15529, partial [Podosphaera aphanis]